MAFLNPTEALGGCVGPPEGSVCPEGTHWGKNSDDIFSLSGFACNGQDDARVLVCEWGGPTNSIAHKEDPLSAQCPGRCENLISKLRPEETAQICHARIEIASRRPTSYFYTACCCQLGHLACRWLGEEGGLQRLGSLPSSAVKCIFFEPLLRT